jgi:hypothetical protein
MNGFLDAPIIRATASLLSCVLCGARAAEVALETAAASTIE